ncbi:MAG: aminotransferase class V-fold PLP-dependent enzyme [Gemmatimonadetes bacterium]|nr:aminotransferase class V-fold PLP-dependent enzyme [Gemmatimonadota bacterium]NIR77360.1 aminotransferase class V-fold PLP-dependent enzyme [Gemmatimonadota bacterium]NIT88305.1 aminotransferase class V-fold PLP-dependent enzyme [Gemmatimonadota bacterium]NIU32118.1 aminotransferase class V-fold PLP-dependent enzyme [Gemmatimonadota bacterium]NIU34739.1 aminotransferase class V-fold PLP-dependent enzyme [Gemmatimonadota bacterium]
MAKALDGDGPGLRFGTRAIHAGQEPDPVTGAIMPPIYQTSTYVQEGLGEPRRGPQGAYDYARVTNPTREALEANVASLEGGRHGIAFSAGLMAIETVVQRLSAGEHVISEENTYGGTTRMFTRVLARLGIEFSFVDTRDPDAVREVVRPETRLLHVETPTNPMMRLCDLRTMAEIAHEAGALLCVDNTFASPYNQRPLELGADVVVHSTTKYINGHSDLIGGIVVVDDDALAEEIRFIRKSTGGVPGTMDAWLCLRGTKTLHVRMDRHNANGTAVARFLEGHSAVGAVHYPGLESHPQHELAKRQMSGFSGMLSAELADADAARALVERTRVFALAESLGGVESLISIPALMTHASVPKERREAMGITDGLVRLSVGIEDEADLLEDLEGALG